MFLINKKIMFAEKRCLLTAKILINNTCYSENKKMTKQRDPHVSEWNHDWTTGTAELHIFRTSVNWQCSNWLTFHWMLHHTIDHTLIFIHWHFYITYTYTYLCNMHWLLRHIRYATVQVSLFPNNLFSIK